MVCRSDTALDDIDVVAIHGFAGMWWDGEICWEWCHHWHGWASKIGYIRRHTGDTPTPETAPPQLASIYALPKYDQEQACLIVGRAYQIPTVAPTRCSTSAAAAVARCAKWPRR